MSKILVLTGPPASGKTTFARNFVKEHDRWVIVSRDSIRSSLGEYWVPDREDLVSKIERDTIISSIQKGWNVIIDATNNNKNTIAKWEAVADEYKCEIEYKDFWIPFHEAIKNDNSPTRERRIGYKVIKSFYERYRPELIDKNWDCRNIKPRGRHKKPAIIADLDGTVTMHCGRSPYSYEKCDEDAPEERLLDILYELQLRGFDILFVSGRENVGNCEAKTNEWLRTHFGLEYKLYLRKENDHRPGYIVKEEIYHDEIEQIYDVVCVFEDNNKCIDMYRNTLGLLTCQPYNLE